MIEKLYSPGRNDLVYGLQNQRVLQTVTDSQASADFITAAFFTVPAQYVCVLDCVSFYLEGGGTQFATAAQLLVTSAGVSYAAGAVTHPAPGTTSPDLLMSIGLKTLLLERDAVSLRGMFSAAVSTNIFKCEIWGTLFPRANIQAARVVG